MHFIAELWLPIVASAAAVFVVSSVLHMLIPIHANDYRKLDNEDAVLGGMRESGVAPGQYMFPRPDSVKEMASPEMIERYERGPVGTMIVLKNGPPALGASLFQWFLFCVLMSVLVANIAHFALPEDATRGAVIHLTGWTAVIGYAFSDVTNSIWRGLRWSTTFKFVFDGVLYSAATALVFGWLWPGI